MNLERFHLICAHERIRDAADAMQGALVCLHQQIGPDADGYFEDAVALLESAMKELGGRIVWPNEPKAGIAETLQSLERVP